MKAITPPLMSRDRTIGNSEEGNIHYGILHHHHHRHVLLLMMKHGERGEEGKESTGGEKKMKRRVKAIRKRVK
jgi:hypothetical protein